MPLYEYKCNNCNERFKEKRSIKENLIPETESECKVCNAVGDNQMIIGTPKISYSINPGMNVSDNFTDRLKQIRKSKGSHLTTIETKN